MPNIPDTLQDEFSYILGLYDGIKEEFTNKIKNNGKIEVVDDISKYNIDKYEAIDGVALKQCDKLSAFVEASLSISHGIKSKELLNGKREILKSLKVVQGIDFKEIAIQIDKEFGSTGQTQAQMDFD